MARRRTDRLNSLLKEVISEVIRDDVRHPGIKSLLTVTRVDITNDLHHAKVYISVIGNDIQRSETIAALQSASGFIAVNSSKKVVMHHFPTLRFILDDSVDKQMRIEEIIHELSTERKVRPNPEEAHES